MNRRALLAAAAPAALLLTATPAFADSAAAPLPSLDEPCTLARVDRYQATTRECLSCHDGMIAPARAISLPAGWGPAASHGDHPVDVSYDQASARNHRLRTRYALSRSLALPGGKVTCVTCHDGASREPRHTSLTMSRSALCLGCHDV